MNVNHTNVNIAATVTIVGSALITIGSCVVCTNPAISTLAMVVFGILAGLGCAGGWAGIAAWMNTHSGNVSDYVENFKNIIAITAMAIVQYVAHRFFQELITFIIAKAFYGRR